MPVLQHKSRTQSIKPANTIVFSFLLVILVGTLLLMLPISSKEREFTSLTDALFTATSATCVTGLIVFDTFTKFSLFGQIVIILMIQIGGIGLVTFATFFNFAIGRKLGLRSMKLAQESINTDSFSDTKTVLRIIVKLSLTLELIGALLLMIVFVPKYSFRGIFISFFLSISAFCNAGFDVLGSEGAYVSLTNYADNPIVMATISGLIICGGLGFVVWFDLFSFIKTKKLILHTKIVLIMTATLLAVGTILFLITEWNSPATMGGMTFMQKFSRAFFMSVTTRTAGFNTIELSELHSISKIISMGLMFIGAAPGSTGGGIKCTTFVVIIMTVVSVVKNKEDTTIFGRRIDKSVVYKALAITMLGGMVVILTTLIIFYTNDSVAGIDALFESISAFATVGLSVGVSGVAGVISKVALILTMFVGRVGPISFALSLTLGSEKRVNQIVPEGKVLVG